MAPREIVKERDTLEAHALSKGTSLFVKILQVWLKGRVCGSVSRAQLLD